MSAPLPPFLDSSSDLELQAASAAIRHYCGWHVWPVVEETLTVDGSGSTALLLPTGKLLAVTECTELPRWASTPYVPSVLDVDTLEWSEKGYVYHWGKWTARARGVVITISHGYAEAPDLAQLAGDMASRQKSAPTGIQQQQVGQRMEIYLRGMLDHEKQQLDFYRIPV